MWKVSSFLFKNSLTFIVIFISISFTAPAEEGKTTFCSSLFLCGDFSFIVLLHRLYARECLYMLAIASILLSCGSEMGVVGLYAFIKNINHVYFYSLSLYSFITHFTLNLLKNLEGRGMHKAHSFPRT